MEKPGLLFYLLGIVLLTGMSCRTLAAPLESQLPANPSPTVPATATTNPTPTPASFQPTPTPTGTATATFLPEVQATAAPDRAATLEAVDVFEPESPPPAEAMAPARMVIQRAEVPVQLELLAQGLAMPAGLASPPDGSGRLFLIDRAGVIYIAGQEGELRPEPFLDLRERFARPGDGFDRRGLQGLAFHPDFAQNGRFYVYYNLPERANRPDGLNHTGRLAEFRVSSWNRHVADPATEQVILEVEQPDWRQAGVQIAIGTDGLLFLHLGDAARAKDDGRLCFDLAQPAVLAVDCAGQDPGETLPGGLQEAYSGANMASSGQPRLAAIAGQTYQGLAFPSFQGRVLFVDRLGSGGQTDSRLYLATPPGQEAHKWTVEELAIANRTGARLVEFVHGIGVDAAGELYLLASESLDVKGETGKVYKIMPQIVAERSIIEDPKEYLPLTYRYARVIRKAPLYKSLDDVRANEPFGAHGGGNYWVSERSQAQVGGGTYYWVGWGWGRYAWISGSDIRFDAPLSHLHGVDLRQRAGEPLAMAYRPVHVRSIPGLISDDTIIGALQPYDLVRVLETRQVDGAIWYRIGPDQWSHGDYLRVFVPSPRPERVEPEEKWVEVNLAEQVVIAHEGDTPVFATLVSTGRRGYETKQGLYRVWAKLREGPMQWEESKLPYSLANVPWIMYFNEGQGLHGAYWHDSFGTVRSAGCVNLSPRDAHWLFHWANPQLEPDQRILYPSKEDPGVWVWVNNLRSDLDSLISSYWLEHREPPADTWLLP